MVKPKDWLTSTIMYFAVVCLFMTWPFVASHTDRQEADGSDNRAEALQSLLSGLDMGKVQELLKEMPPEKMAELKQQASRVMGQLSANIDVLKPASEQDEIVDDGADHSPRSAEDIENSVELPSLSGGKQGAPKMPKPSAYHYDQSSSKKRGETSEIPNAKNQQNPMDPLVLMAKKLLGHDESDPTLDLMAKMASNYMQLASSSDQPAGSGSSGPDLNSVIQMASFLAGGGKNGQAGANPLESLASLMGNSGVDFSQLLQVGSALMGQNAVKQTQSRDKTQSASPVVELLLRFLANTVSVDPDDLVNYYEGLSSLSTATSWDEINAILRRTTGTDAEALLDALANNEMRQEMSDTTTSTLVDWLQTFLNPDSLKMRVLYINALLLQYGYPTIDDKNLIETTSLVVERFSTQFLDTRVDLRPYLREINKEFKLMLKVDQNDTIDFRKFSHEQLAHAVEYSMKSEVFDPLADFWADFRLASRHPKCARTIVCLRNSPRTTRTTLGLKEGITRATSTVVVWALSKTNNRGMPPFEALFQAAYDGARGVDCEKRYHENCAEVLKEPAISMRLGYQHQEL